MSDETFNLLVRVKAEVDQAIRDLDKLDNELQDNEQNVGAFGVAAGVAAGIITTQFLSALKDTVIESINLAAQFGPIQSGFNRLTEGVDESVISIDSLRDSVGGTVNDMELMKAASQALSLGLPVERLNDLFASAKLVGNTLGRTTLQAVNDLTTGIGRQSKLILDNLGIIVDTDKAYQDFADTLGKTVSELDASERSLAFNEAAFEAVTSAGQRLEGTQNELTDTLAVWNATVENTKIKLGEFAGASIVAWTRFGSAVSENLNAAGDAIADFEQGFADTREATVSDQNKIAQGFNELQATGQTALESLATDYSELSTAANAALDDAIAKNKEFEDSLSSSVTLLDDAATKLALFEAEVVGVTESERRRAEEAEAGAILTIGARTGFGAGAFVPGEVTVIIENATLDPDNVDEVFDELMEKFNEELVRQGGGEP